MGLTSKTGLTASPTKKVYRIEKPPPVQLKAVAKRAPFILKPLAGLFNPYPYGCSLLCNHPADNDARELLKKAKDMWAEGKNILLPDEIEAIKCELEHLHSHDRNLLTQGNIDHIIAVESVPEELFRRYTETDSRPLTPAPTLASAFTRASGSRRCFTPDPQPTTKIHEKTLLILDLRRSHSQETLSCYGSSSFLEPPIIRIQQAPTRTASLEDLQCTRRSRSKGPSSLSTPNAFKRPKSKQPKHLEVEHIDITKDEPLPNSGIPFGDQEDENGDEFITRRGKKKRRKGRDSSRSLLPVQTSMDPETQIATVGDESCENTARQSIVHGGSSQDIPDIIDGRKKKEIGKDKSLEVDSYLDVDILKHLRRQLTEEIVEMEFNMKRKLALKEALKTVSKDKIDCEELVRLQRELSLPPVKTDMWLHLPRAFSRSSARFELPMDSRTLATMKPLVYLKKHVGVTSPRKLLYNCIFNKYKEDGETDRRISIKNLQQALDSMMGKAMTKEQKEYIQQITEWREQDLLDFETFCGLCALCERLLAAEYCPQLPDKQIDPCQQLEKTDFESLTRKLEGKSANENLVKILYRIKNA